MKATRVLPLLVLAALAVGCGRDDDTPAAATDAATTQQPVSGAASHMPQAAPQPHAPADSGQSRLAAAVPPPLNPHAARDIPSFPSTGATACDNYAEAVRQCLNAHTYGMDRLKLRREFIKSVRGWKQSVDAGTADSVVAQQCTAFRDAFRARLQAVGCTGI